MITRMKLVFLSYLGDYSYSFQGLPNQLALQLQFLVFSSRTQLQEIIPLGNAQEISAIAVTLDVTSTVSFFVEHNVQKQR